MKILHLCPTFSSPTCGIGRYTQHLVQGIKAVSPDTQQMVLDGFSSVRQTLLEHRPDVCHIQLEYGFCSPERLQLIEGYCRETKTYLVITFHTIAAAPHNQATKYAMRLAHTPLAHNYGKFFIIPSGIPVQSYGPMPSDFRLDKPYLFFGQAHPHKQLWETLQAVIRRPSRKLLCIVSKPVQGSTAYYDKCKTLARTMPNVVWPEAFVDDQEVLEHSTQCCAALFPYVEYGSIGVSAAVKLLLNNPTLPIYTTYASHFSDIPNHNEVLNKFETLGEMLLSTATHTVDARKQWVADHNFSKIAEAHLNLYRP